MTATRDRLVTEAATPRTNGHRHSRPNPPAFTSHSPMISLEATATPFRTIGVLILIPVPEVAPLPVRVTFPAVLPPTNPPTRAPKAAPAPSPRSRSTSSSSSIKTWPSRIRPISLPTPETRPVNLPTPRTLPIAVGTRITTRTRSIALPIPPTRRVTSNPTPVPKPCPSLCPSRLRLNKAAGASFWLRGTRSIRAQNMAMSTRICCCRRHPWVRWVRHGRRDEWTSTRRLLVRGFMRIHSHRGFEGG